ncbi:lysozyme inhibitor LprI family protein [Leeia oryzae]|uniref:lysozyme inhibitor LprI family protein n=1 Tax=Leeia oryzae TaxID=356662 RepID=UPI000374DC39|nr:lysozyme inhibitor LprI family protein [Leeia oryzae]
MLTSKHILAGIFCLATTTMSFAEYTPYQNLPTADKLCGGRNDQANCLEQQINRYQSKMQNTINKLNKVVKNNPTALKGVRNGQASWVAYVQADCSANAEAFGSGFNQGIQYAFCQLDRSILRAHDLQDLYDYFTQD